MWIILGLTAAIASAVVLIFNSLVAAKQLVENGWSDIEVQLKRRGDLIPRLVMTVKAYAKHEKDLFLDITEKRNQALAAGNDPKKRGAAESAVARPVTKLLAIAEDYPDLKANQNFLDLQDELSDTENTIEMARRFYNGAVRENNIKVQSFPAVLIAGLFGFGGRDYFQVETSEASNPHIDFEY
ncbi:MAG: LemA family protein [Alphaproteobacteria bacterium]